MVREVDLMSYLPLFMQGYREPAATLTQSSAPLHNIPAHAFSSM